MKIYMCGIAGTGMSSLAGLFKEKGYEVSGSDTAFYPPTGTVLKQMDIELFETYNALNIPHETDLCVIGNIISRGNPEAEFILDKGMSFVSMPQALYSHFIQGRESIVVAGTHGKTTISGFIAYMLEQAGEKPGYFIGGKPEGLQNGYSIGEGRFFVTEGDEYETAFFDRSSKFLKYFPKYLVLTALEYDHLDFFRTPEDYKYAFRNLVNQVPSGGKIILNSGYPLGKEVVKESLTEVISYGDINTDARVQNISLSGEGSKFELVYRGEIEKYFTPLPGKYNIDNLIAGILIGKILGLSHREIKNAVRTYRGVKRRLVNLGTISSTTFFEDFAHHPTEIRGVLSSLREMFPEHRLILLLDSGSNSMKRREFENALIESLNYADEIILKKIDWKGRIPVKKQVRQDLIIENLNKAGKFVKIMDNYEDMSKYIHNIDTGEKQIVALLSNGSFGGIPGSITGIIKS